MTSRLAAPQPDFAKIVLIAVELATWRKSEKPRSGLTWGHFRPKWPTNMDSLYPRRWTLWKFLTEKLDSLEKRRESGAFDAEVDLELRNITKKLPGKATPTIPAG